MRRGNVGLDGAESQHCDLSGRGLNVAQVERTLRVFETASAIDLSNNEIEKIPSTIPPEVVALDLSFNLISSLHGIERLQNLQELHLSFNRLVDVSILELCPRLVRVNLSGNRLMNTKGIETLVNLENLDLSDNLIEFPEAIRPLSLNQQLTHLKLQGNPISLKTDYRVLLLDILPSVLILDDKKIRAGIKSKTLDGQAIKSLSYSRLYGDKKEFIINKENRPRPATKARGVLPGKSTAKYDSTMFLQPPDGFTYERAQSQQLEAEGTTPAPNIPYSSSLSLSQTDTRTTMTGGCGAPYVSLYDRLVNTKASSNYEIRSNAPPSRPIETRVTNLPSKKVASTANQDNNSQPVSMTKKIASPAKTTTLRGRAAPQQQPSVRTYSIHDAASSRRPSTLAAPQPTIPYVQPPPPPVSLDTKQKNVMNVIQNLIRHKKQTLAELARPAMNSSIPTRVTSISGQLVR